MSRHSTMRALAGASLAALALGAIPAAAQTAGGGATGCGGPDCRTRSETRVQVTGATPEERARRAAVAAQLRVAIERARVAAERVSDTHEGSTLRAMRELERGLERLRPDDPAFSAQMLQLQRLAERHTEIVQMDPEFRSALKDIARLQDDLARLSVRPAQRPVGYLGVTYSSEMRRYEKEGELYAFHGDYPAIVSVEPGSPADRAGLRRGDTIIAYNRQDLRRREVSLSRLLVPEERLTVTVRRDGEKRDVPVLVGRSPGTRIAARVAPTVTWCFEGQECRVERVQPPTPVPAPRPPRPPRAGVDGPLPPTPAEAPTPTVRYIPSTPMIYAPGTSTVAFAGAEMTRVEEDMREVLGTSQGMLVIRVARSTPAQRAGLRAGDVIVRAAGSRIASPQGLREAYIRSASRAGATGMELEVVRKGKEQKILLSWGEPER